MQKYDNPMDHLVDALKDETPEEDALTKISTLGEEFKDMTANKKILELQLKELNVKLTELSQVEIPQAMIAVNMSSFSLTSGETISYKEEVSTTLRDPERFYDFLEERGDGALMKIQLEIGKVPKSILAQIVKKLHEVFEILPAVKMGIHHATLKKYIKELCGIGGTTEAEMPLEELDETMIGTFVFYKTTIK